MQIQASMGSSGHLGWMVAVPVLAVAWATVLQKTSGLVQKASRLNFVALFKILLPDRSESGSELRSLLPKSDILHS